MSAFRRSMPVLCALFLSIATFAQNTIKGKIIDAATKEPIAGASVQCGKEGCGCGCQSNTAGEFNLHCTACGNHTVSFVGYESKALPASGASLLIELSAVASQLQSVVLTANRGEGARRSEAPVAIAAITSRMLQDARPTSFDQVLNKVSGVNMVNLGNEQHQMSIRQPMSTKSLFLYLEDGIPIRTTGLFNHNALLEMNMAAVRSLEVIKGPSSSLYGSEAIGGVVNFITAAPTSVPVAKLSMQGNNIGYKRADLLSSFSAGRWGVVLSGYMAGKRNGFLEYSDYQKRTVTVRADYRFSDKTAVVNSLTWLDYYSDMAGGIDSAMFASRTFRNQQTFTYRKVDALRYRSTLSHNWREGSKTTISALFRRNSIGQNPAYRIKDDYRKVNGVFRGQKDLAHGELNDNSFRSYALIAQHRQNLVWKKAVLLGGLHLDLSPSTYRARYIRIQKDTLARKYVGYQNTDSILTQYSTGLNNFAGFLNFECAPVNRLRVVASLRYDLFHYRFNNALQPSAFSGSPDTANNFRRLSPKVGLTYNFTARMGVYANYSQGFVPPQVTELYTGVKVPNIKPSVFYNYEAGGWAQIVKDRLSADLSLYQLEGTDEIVSVKLDDGSFANQNAGRTLHKGIELGVSGTPVSNVTIRVSSAWSRHTYVAYVEKGTAYNGNQMNGAPNWLSNAELWYKPAFARGLRLGAEYQLVGPYYMDPANASRYKGYQVVHLRAGYGFKGCEVWLNVLNASDRYYATTASRSSSGYSYQLAEPRNFNFGISYDFGALVKQ